MPIDCKALFDQAWMRVQAIPGIKTLAQTPMYVVNAADLPRMMMTAETDMPAWGDPTAGPPKYDATITFYFSLVTAGSADDLDLTELNATMDMVEAVLLTDPKFLKQVRGFTGMRRQNPNFSQIQETNVCELRQTISFLMHQIIFLPTINDYFKTLGIITKPAPQVQGEGKPLPPTIYRQWEMFGGAVGNMRVVEAPDKVNMTWDFPADLTGTMAAVEAPDSVSMSGKVT
jgi:hypothetical protein